MSDRPQHEPEVREARRRAEFQRDVALLAQGDWLAAERVAAALRHSRAWLTPDKRDRPACGRSWASCCACTGSGARLRREGWRPNSNIPIFGSMRDIYLLKLAMLADGVVPEEVDGKRVPRDLLSRMRVAGLIHQQMGHYEYTITNRGRDRVMAELRREGLI